MSRRFIGVLKFNEEVVVEKGCVYAKERFDKSIWARGILDKWETPSIDYYVCPAAKTVIAYYQRGCWANKKPGVSSCRPDDKFDITIGKAIALCRLKGLRIPKEIFE